MNQSHKNKASVLKALGHPIRYCIVEGLISGENNVSTMVACTSVPQPTVSQHLNVLRAAGIIECKREGTQMFYSVCSADARRIVSALK
jgi:DNA-binding transcriptional ArsR family regulator